jgi:hypothetical protein
LKYMSNKMKISLKTMPKATLVKSGVVNTAYTSCNHSWLFYLTWTTWTSGPEGWYRWLASAKARTECSEVVRGASCHRKYEFEYYFLRLLW